MSTISNPFEMFDVKGKTALITGASGAFGMVAARVLSGAGCNLVLVAGNQDALEERHRRRSHSSVDDCFSTANARHG